jgi:hypothetical protein
MPGKHGDPNWTFGAKKHIRSTPKDSNTWLLGSWRRNGNLGQAGTKMDKDGQSAKAQRLTRTRGFKYLQMGSILCVVGWRVSICLESSCRISRNVVRERASRNLEYFSIFKSFGSWFILIYLDSLGPRPYPASCLEKPAEQGGFTYLYLPSNYMWKE